jgi:hypothetical protein
VIIGYGIKAYARGRKGKILSFFWEWTEVQGTQKLAEVRR